MKLFRGGFCFSGGCWLVASVVGVGYLGRVASVGSVVGLWFSGGWCFRWQFFLVILVVKNQCLWLSFDGRWLCGFIGE